MVRSNQGRDTGRDARHAVGSWEPLRICYCPGSCQNDQRELKKASFCLRHISCSKHHFVAAQRRAIDSLHIFNSNKLTFGVFLIQND